MYGQTSALSWYKLYMIQRLLGTLNFHSLARTGPCPTKPNLIMPWITHFGITPQFPFLGRHSLGDNFNIAAWACYSMLHLLGSKDWYQLMGRYVILWCLFLVLLLKAPTHRTWKQKKECSEYMKELEKSWWGVLYSLSPRPALSPWKGL